MSPGSPHLPDSPCRIFIALGSNQGDSVRIVREAMDRLQAWSIRPVQRSSLWRSSPVDCPPGSSDFINAVLGLNCHPEVTPESLLTGLQALEQEFGRQPKRQINEARPLDLDLLLFGDERRTSDRLTLPHPRAHQRRFVLEPLGEIAPHLLWPGLGKSVADLRADLRGSAPPMRAATEDRSNPLRLHPRESE